jgi:hypothetical protein
MSFLSTTAIAATLYVDVNSTNPVPPYANWQTAAANIQDAVDAARGGDTVLVAGGIYSTGSRASPDGTTNRVSVTTPITLQNFNGSAATSIDGGGVMRCVYLCDGALLSGFTLTNGNVASASAPNGGGVGCASTNAVVANCILVNNIANSGGGAFSGTLTNCFLLHNTADGANAGGGAAGSTLYACTLSGNVTHGSYFGGGGAHGCTLSNCVVTNNAADWSAGGGVSQSTAHNCLISNNSAQYGGGAYEASVHNCTLSGNSASYGGGEETSTLVNCLITSNTASSDGGGAYYGTLINCTVTGNTSSSGSGGGACNATVENSIVYYNFRGAVASDDYACTLINSCTPTAAGAGNTSNAPAFDSAYHLLAGSPCIDAGSNAFATTTLDLAGNLRIINGRVDMGTFEYHFASPLTVSVQANYTNMVVGYPVQFSGTLNGGRSACWTFADGTVISNVLAVAHAWNAVGDYPVTFTVYDDNYPSGVSASVLIHVIAPPVMYVNPGCTNPVAPFSSWETAATNIQDAVDTAGIGYHIVVTNGTYATGNRLTTDGVQNRVAITNAITLRSVNGSAVTSIDGGQAVRCVSLASGAALIGFTLTKGKGGNGGGVACASTNERVLDCQLVSNSGILGGGVYGGSLSNCTLSGNVLGSGNDTRGGGAYGSILNYCTLTYNRNGYNVSVFGSGAFGCTLNFCTINNNVANSEWSDGAGICSSTANNCTISGNSGTYVSGGGAAYSSLSNCVIIGNNAVEGGAGYSSTFVNCTLSGNVATWGGGSYLSTLHNCVLFGNTAYQDGGGSGRSSLYGCTVVGNHATYSGGGVDGDGRGCVNSIIFNNTSTFNEPNYNGSTTLNYCCTVPLPPSGVGNIATDPLFVNYGASDLHLQTNSPCVEAGNNAYVTVTNDLDGSPRIVGNNVDIGAYEFQSPTFITHQPRSQTAYGTYTAGFNVVAVSPLPLSYQWRFNGTNIQGATTSSLTLTNLQLTNAGSYSVQVSNVLASIISSNAVLTVVFPPPVITLTPTNLTVVEGTTAVFSVSAFSPYPMAFQWLRYGTNLMDGGRFSGSTNASLSVSDVRLADQGPYQVIITNSYGAVTSAIAWLTVLADPVLLAQPSDSVLMVFSTANFSVIATGAPPFSYQWQKDGISLSDDGRITGVVSASLTIANLQTTDSGQYSVIVSNAFGTAQSTNASLTVVPIVSWGYSDSGIPAAATNLLAIAEGGDIGWSTFSLVLRADCTVVAWGSGAYGSTNVPDIATNVVAIAAGEYHGLALHQDGSLVGWGDNRYGQASPPADATNVVAVAGGDWHSLALRQDGTVVGWGNSVPPAGVSNVIAIAAGSGFSLALRPDGTVMALGTNDYGAASPPASATNVIAIAVGERHSLALRSDGTIVGWGFGGNGETTPPADATNIIAIAAGSFRSAALRRNGTVLSWGWTSYGQPLPPTNLADVVAISAKRYHDMALVRHPTAPLAPRLVQHPLSCTLLVGQTTVFMSQATGSLPLEYQWYSNGSPLDGQTNNWLALTSVRLDQAGDYRVVMTNNSGAVTSQVATLTVAREAGIAAQPASQSMVLNNTAMFTVGMFGLPPFYYQWYFNGSPLTDGSHSSGTTTASLSISNVQIADGGTYSVVVTNAYNAVTSTLATLTVLVPATITNQPADQSVLLNSNATFTVSATGTGTLTYRWMKDGTNLNNGGRIAGATSPTLTVSGAQTNDTGPYQAIVSNTYGTTTSTVATLTVHIPVQITAQPSSTAVLIGSNASFAVAASGTSLGYQWFLNGTPLVDDARISGTTTPSLVISNVLATDVGGYWVSVSNLLTSARSMTASLTPLVTSTSSVRYVDLNSASPAPPYLGWPTAATNIQDAVDAAVDGDLVLVTNGLYRTGGRVVYGSLTNRLVVNKAVVVQSINGPAATVIEGTRPAGDTAIRCVYLTSNASLIGFTLTNGATRGAGDLLTERSGGGAWCESTNCLVANCLFISNAVTVCGGGLFSGTSSNCSFAYNSAATNGGACFGGVLTSCTLLTNCALNGGGACSNTLSGCTLIGNYATNSGGGAFGGVLTSCTLTTNRASKGAGACSNTLSACTLIANYATSIGGGAYGTRLINCTVALNTNAGHGAGLHSCVATGCVISNNVSTSGYGGGAYTSSLTNCMVLRNTAGRGGGAYNSSMSFCTISGNLALGSYGGGAYVGAFNNCLIVSNSASFSSGADSGILTNCTIVGHTNGRAAYVCTAYNSILYYNANNWSSSTLRSCCTWPLPSGSVNFTNAPLFVDLPGGNLHLQTTSPCINAGNNAYVVSATDLDGVPRVVGGTVDVGAYECQSPALLDFFLWMQSYGLPTAASATYADADSDHHNNWQEWTAGTDPTNAASLLRLQPPAVAPPGLVLRWTSDTNHTYFVERATNLATPLSFSLLKTNLPGLPGTTAYTDTTAPLLPAAFYRVGADSTNHSSPLSLHPPVIFPGSVTLIWSSVTTRSYAVERATNPCVPPAFSVLRSNLPGQPGTTSFIDTNPVTATPRFYRVRVEQ